MSTIMLWPFRSSLIAVTVMMVVVFHVSAQANSPKKHRGLCEIHYPSDVMLDWDCRVIPLPLGPRVHIIGQAPAHITHKPQ